MSNDASDGLLIRGIDGTTPLGFLAGLGLLQVMTDTRLPEHQAPLIAWKRFDTWRPIVHGAASLESVAQTVFDDSQGWADSALLRFRYVKQEKQGPKAVGGLRAPLSVVRAWSRSQREEQGEAALAYGAALFCDCVTEINKKPATEQDHRSEEIAVDPEVDIAHTVERTFFDLTARNAQFLEQVELIRSYLNLEGIGRALAQGEPDYEAPRTLDWDPSSDTPGAIYTGFRRAYLPVHEWLGFRALRLFPVASYGSRVRMTACTGRRLDGEFTWPLWERPVTVDVVRSLLGHPRLSTLTHEERRAFGISELLCAGLTKKADGYTGTFAPARPV